MYGLKQLKYAINQCTMMKLGFDNINLSMQIEAMDVSTSIGEGFCTIFFFVVR